MKEAEPIKVKEQIEQLIRKESKKNSPQTEWRRLHLGDNNHFLTVDSKENGYIVSRGSKHEEAFDFEQIHVSGDRLSYTHVLLKKGESESLSNGLQIDNELAIEGAQHILRPFSKRNLRKTKSQD